MMPRRSRCLASLFGIAVLTAGASSSADEKEVMSTETAIFNLVNYASTVYSGFQAAEALALAMGILGDPNQQLDDEIAQLNQHIDESANSISWLINENAQQARVHSLLSEVMAVHDQVRAGVTPDWANLDVDTAGQVGQATADANFLRYYIDSSTDGTAIGTPYDPAILTWKYAIPYSTTDLHYDNGYVYDWRLGVPTLVSMIGLRIQLMAMEDPNFASDGRFHDELMNYHDVLVKHLNTMTAGIRCGIRDLSAGGNGSGGEPDLWPEITYPPRYLLACADIYTGDAILSHTEWPYELPGQSCNPSQIDPSSPHAAANCQLFKEQWYENDVLAWPDANWQPMRNRTPWFQLQSLIDTLYLYANGVPELTSYDDSIHFWNNPGLCLDVQNANPNPGTPVQLYYCNASDAQVWVYDRTAQTVTNPSLGVCLTLQAASTAPGTPVWTGTCNGSDTQKWSWDPEQFVLTNKLGNVLDVPNDNEQAQQTLWTYPVNYSNAQAWQ